MGNASDTLTIVLAGILTMSVLFSIGLEIPIPSAFIHINEVIESAYQTARRRCYLCGAIEHVRDDFNAPNADHSAVIMCDKCFDESMQCPACDYYHNDGDDCLAKMRECTYCNDKHNAEDSYDYDREVCNDCCHSTFICEDCGSRRDVDDATSNNDDETICRDCANHYYTCDECDIMYNDDDRIDDGEYVFCSESCQYKHTAKIRDDYNGSYTYKDDIIGKGPLFMGAEWELELTGDCATIMKRLTYLPNMEFHEDSSISNNINCFDLELTTMPMDMSSHYDFWDHLFVRMGDDIGDGLNSQWGGRHQCGFHIHINKEALSALSLGKILVFINDDENTDFITKIAGRATHYAHRAPKNITDIGRADDHDAINTCTKHGTFEFRIFAGTNDKAIILSYLEFVHSLVAWAPMVGIRDISTTSYLSWLKVNRKSYQNLWARVSEFIVLL